MNPSEKLPKRKPKAHEAPASPGSLFKNLLLYLFFSGLVIAGAWFWLTGQLKYLLEQRVAETGLELAEITAIASAEAVLSEDKDYLTQLLQQLVSKKTILQASIYRLDGTLLVEQSASGAQPQSNAAPLTTTEATAGDDDKLPQQSAELTPDTWPSLEHLLTAHLPRYQTPDTPFMVEIPWQNTSVGWLKLTLDRWQLEQDFRSRSYQITLYSLIAFALSSVLAFGALWRKRRPPASQEDNAEVPETAPVTPEIHSLRDAAAQIKQQHHHSQLRFKAVNLHRFTPLNPATEHHRGLVQLFSLKLKYTQDCSPELLLTQQLMWHNIMFDAAALWELPIKMIGRHQYLVTGKPAQLNTMIKLGFLIHNIRQHLEQLPQLSCHCSMLLGKSDLYYKPIDSHMAFVAGEVFNRWLIKLRQLKGFGLIDESLVEELSLETKDPDLHQVAIEIENHPDNSVVLEPREQAIIERQAESLLRKYRQQERITASSETPEHR